MAATPRLRFDATTPAVLLVVGAASAVAAAVVFRLARAPEGERGKDADAAAIKLTEPPSNDGELPAPRRCGGAIRLRPGMYDRYRELHDAVWPQVLERMSQSHVRNFTIYYHHETSTLFHHFEWVGHWVRLLEEREVRRRRGMLAPSTEAEEREWFEADMQAIADDPVTRQWWRECEPCQQPFGQWPLGSPPPSEGGSGNPWWAPLECVAHCGHWPLVYSRHTSDPDFKTLETKRE